MLYVYRQTATETVRTLIAYGYSIEAPTLEAESKYVVIVRSTLTLEGGNVRPSVGTSVSPYVRTSVRPQKVCPISMKCGLCIEVDE